MRELGFIDEATAEAASQEPWCARAHAPLFDVEAPYVAEMVRLELASASAPRAESAGYKVYTTIDGRLQTAANRALRIGLIEYDRRHGWRGPLGHSEVGRGERDAAKLETLLDEYSQRRRCCCRPSSSRWRRSTARVFVKGRGLGADRLGRAVAGRGAAARLRSGRPEDAPAKSCAPATSSTSCTRRQGRGAARAGARGAERARRARSATTARSSSLVGGFDYFTNKYNRVTQAQRQPGSGFKPFLYSAALENGFTPATMMLDAPIVLEGEGMEDVVAAGELRRRVPRPDAPARSAGALAQSGVDPPAARDGHGARRSTTSRASASTQGALPDNLTLALGTHAGHAARDGDRLRGVRQRRLPREAVSTSTASKAGGQIVYGRAASRMRECEQPSKPSRERPCQATA